MSLVRRSAALCMPLFICLSLPESAAAVARPVHGLPSTVSVAVCEPAQLPVAVHRPGAPPAATTSGSPLEATLRVVRAASAEERAAFHQRALESAALAGARQRLAPLIIDTSAPRAVGTSVGLLGVYYPIRGAMDGVTSQYALWFDTASGAVVAEADFVRRAEGQVARLVAGGTVVLDGRLAEPNRTADDFWSCLDWCLGAVADDDLILVLHAACVKYCGPWPTQWCVACLVAVGALEVGMVSGCTYSCWRG